jgi:hypothetical protein
MRHVSIDEEEDPEAREVHINHICRARQHIIMRAISQKRDLFLLFLSYQATY